MRNGAIVVATIGETPAFGVVKQHDASGLTAIFPVIETESSILSARNTPARSNSPGIPCLYVLLKRPENRLMWANPD
jgi:hypothetical protein